MTTELRVLIVEDSLLTAGIMAQAFRSEGHRVMVAATLDEARGWFAAQPFDVAVLDYHLPDGQGSDLLVPFREARPDCVCLMITTDPDPELSMNWLGLGAAAILRKPFSPAYLLELCALARRERSLLRAQDLLEKRTRDLDRLETLHRTTIDHLDEALHVVDRDLRVVLFNQRLRAWCDELGLTGEMKGSPILEAFPFLPESSLEEYRQVIQTGRILVTEEQHDLSVGTIFTRSRKIPIMTGEQVTGVITVITDITENKMAESELLDSRRLIRTIVDTVPVRLFWKDKNLQYLGCNTPFARDAGLKSPEEILGRDDRELSWKDMADLYRADDRLVIETGQSKLLFEEPQSQGGGKVIHLLTSKVPLRDETGQVMGVLGCYMDITERQAAEQERQQLQAQLNQAQKMESVGRLAGGVAHDFNNMLGVILGHVEMTLEDLTPGSHLHGELQEIQKAAQRSADLTRQLLAFARKQTVSPRLVDLNEVVEGMLKMLHRLIGEDVKLIWLPAAHLESVLIDPSQVDQLLANLCVNARDAIGGAGQVVIETGNEVLDQAWCDGHPGSVVGAFVRLTVRDNGCGMDKEVLENLFEPFFTTKEPGKGTGLGLATVYGIMRQNKGFIDVVSEPGAGSSFHLYLPCHRDRPGSGTDGGVRRTLVFNHETILVVEDELANLKLTAVMLRRLGLEVLTAETPADAIELAKTHTRVIQLLITDVIMPEMNGQELARILTGICPGLKCLFMSGYTSEVIGRHGLMDEAVHFLQKPFTLSDLQEKVSQAMGSTE